jgi:15-cis-phytoene synthase
METSARFARPEGVLVRSWRRCLNLAGISGDALRADYTAADRFIRDREFPLWAMMRLLTPPEFQPHAAAGSALATFTDDMCDRGAVAERQQRFDAWTALVRAALDTGDSSDPLLRAYLHSADEYGLPRSWADAYLDGSRIDLDFPGFAEEADYQRYIDTLTWPALMLFTGMTPHIVPDEEFASSCRLVADAVQRTDFLTDLAEDLRVGHLALPMSDLDRHGVARTDLEEGLDTPGVRALISATADTARGTLTAASRIIGEVAPAYRPLTRCLIGIHHLRLDKVSALGSALTRRPVRDNPVECLRLLVRSRRADHLPPRPGSHDSLGSLDDEPSRTADETSSV